MALNWDSIHAGPISQEEIRQYVDRENWQEVRRDLKGRPLEERFNILRRWLRTHSNSRAAQVQVTNYINALARGGMIPSLAKRSEAMPTFEITKVDADEQLVFGFAYVSIDKNGERVVDHSQEVVDATDLEKAAYDFNLNFRESGVMHRGSAVGHLVESFVVSPDKLAYMGIDSVTKMIGWWVGFHIPDKEVFSKVKDGTYAMFSIQGHATREETA